MRKIGILVDCPTCKVPAGKRCVKIGSAAYPMLAPHPLRAKKARALAVRPFR